ncbi:unnamed protein product [Amoebophrya sp. A120]|nr:unnamed protein product [Amoebophrya sp. A120]|eukprot:GSA120T00013061001.1
MPNLSSSSSSHGRLAAPNTGGSTPPRTRPGRPAASPLLRSRTPPRVSKNESQNVVVLLSSSDDEEGEEADSESSNTAKNGEESDDESQFASSDSESESGTSESGIGNANDAAPGAAAALAAAPAVSQPQPNNQNQHQNQKVDRVNSLDSDGESSSGPELTADFLRDIRRAVRTGGGEAELRNKLVDAGVLKRKQPDPVAAESEQEDLVEGDEPKYLSDEDSQSSCSDHDSESLLEGDLEEEDDGLQPDEFPNPGGLQPGDKGFVKFLHTGTFFKTFAFKKLDPGASAADKLVQLLPHQKALLYLFETGRCTRMVVDHRTGSGKTRTQIAMLSADYAIARAKVIVLPKRHHVENLVKEFLTWPNIWRDFFAASCAESVYELLGTNNWVAKKEEKWKVNMTAQLCSQFCDVVGLKGQIVQGKVKSGWAANFEMDKGITPPAAPLRIFSYATAGGRAMGYNREGLKTQAVDPALKFRLNPENALAGKLVIMDEAHNLIRPTEERFKLPLQRLREAISSTSARGTKSKPGTWVYLMTATPVIVGQNPRALLDIVKGKGRDDRTDEGFISTMHEELKEHYPRVVMNRPDVDKKLGSGLQLSGSLPVGLKGRSAARYVLKHAVEVGDQDAQRVKKLSVYTVSALPPQTIGKMEDAQLIELRKELCPKICKVISMTRERSLKTLVIVARRTGFLAAKRLLEHAFPGKVAFFEDLSRFNCGETNLRGEKFVIMLATREECGEGIEFRGVRDFHALDIPLSATEYAQLCGRAVRMGSHSGLPKADQTVSIYLHKAKLPKWSGVTRSRVVALARSRKYRDEYKTGLRYWSQHDEPPKGVRTCGDEAPTSTIDSQLVKDLEKSLKKKTKILDRMRAAAVDFGLYAQR